MSLIYMCTLGQRPEAITVALDKLSQQYQYDGVVVLHTEPNHSGIKDAYRELMAVLRRDYQDLLIRGHPLCYENEDPILDIDTPQSAAAYHLSVLYALMDHKQEGHTIHLMVAGGRKAMSIYATLAATLILREPDRVFTVISPAALLQKPHIFHVSAPQLDQVHVIDLPFLESRLMPGYVRALLSDTHTHRNIGQELWNSLTKKQRALASILERNPYASNRELAELLRRKPSTVENQLGAIYKKLEQYYTLGPHERKRQRLIAVLRQRESLR